MTIEPKPMREPSIHNDDIAWRLRAATRDLTFSSVSRTTGHHPETVRRYMTGAVTVPATFVRSISELSGVDAGPLLFGDSYTLSQEQLKYATWDQLFRELARRAKRLDDLTIGSFVLDQLSDPAHRSDLESRTDEPNWNQLGSEPPLD